jgi:heme/copper-type cytochrome/quinol oxidase subunit 4
MTRTLRIILRIVTLLATALGVLLYGDTIFLSIINWRQVPSSHSSLLLAVRYILVDTIFGAGLPPLLITLYFFLRCNTPRAWGIGLGWLVLFIFGHFVTVVFITHSTWPIYMPMVLVELFGAIFVIWRHERWRSLGVTAPESGVRP